MNFQRLLHVIHKEFVRIRRDPASLRLLVVGPLLQLVMFGYAATNDVKDVPVAIYDGDRTAESRLLIQEVGHSYYFEVLPQVSDPRQLGEMLLRGTAQLGIYIPPQFARTMKRGQTAQVGLLVDGSDANTAGLATSYLLGLLAQRGLNWQLQDARSQGVLGEQVPGVTPVPRVWYNVELTSVNFMVPAVFGMILLAITVSLSSLSVVRERETGTLEQLLVTPLEASELIVGKMIPLGLIAFFESGLIVLIAIFWFQVPCRGSFVLLFGMGAIFLISNLALGMAISVVSHTQQEAQILSFLLIMPSVLLSGFMFPFRTCRTRCRS